MSQPDRIIGIDGGLQTVMTRVELVAKSDAPVLLLGETGTGKEVIARAIHERSARRAGPFWRVNCGALAPELVDSELFGHERGSFTGAMARRKGWFEQAHEGTLFLDEIAELSPAAQVRLLRVVQDGELLRLGGEQSVHVDVRLVAATHRNLPVMVSARTFREDLYYRMAVFPIAIPPLRERQSDIGPLAEYFAERAARRFGVRASSVSEADTHLLERYAWPGNVRELAAVIDRAVLLGDGHGLKVGIALGPLPDARRSEEPLEEPLVQERGDIEPLDNIVRRHIERALHASHGRLEGPFGAARLLRVNPHTLRARMRKLNIDWRAFRTGARDAGHR